MDKLQPILKQKFWIILGVGLIMTIVGWWMATGSLAATIAARKTEIENAEKMIPSGELPNESWSSQLSQINTRQEAMVQTVRRQMWEQQKATMTWPENVSDFAVDLPYRGDFNLVARNLYRSAYNFAVEETWRLVRPIELDGSGIVQFPIEKMPIKDGVVGDLAPSSQVIWDAQEDLWITAPILRAIREVNGGENATRGDAAVHIIDNFELLGGERLEGEAPAGDGGGMMDPGMEGMGGMMMGGGGGSRAGDGKPRSADFGPEEEFGTTGRDKGNSGGGGMMGMGGMGMEGMGMDGSGGGEAPQIRRYVDDDESVPYRTRAFYISMVMDHRKVPALLGELTAGGNSPWPIEIMRVQMSRVNPDDAEGRNLGMNSMMAGPGGGGMLPEEIMPFDAGPDGLSIIQPSMPSGNQPVVQQLSLETVLQDPFIAKVAIAGLIYMYRPVDPPAAEESPAAEEGTAPADDGTMPAEATDAAAPALTGEPAAPADATTGSAAPPEDTTAPAAADPGATTTPAPAAGVTPADGTTPAPAAPSAAAPPATGAAPATPPAADSAAPSPATNP